jgi:hypothetical protein
MNRKKPQTKPRVYVMRSWNFKEQNIVINVHEYEGTSWKENHGIQKTGIEDCTEI